MGGAFVVSVSVPSPQVWLPDFGVWSTKCMDHLGRVLAEFVHI